MSKNRKQPKTSMKGPKGKQEAMNYTRPTIPDHMKLTKAELIYFDNIIDARSEDQWYPADLELAVILAQSKNALYKQQIKLRREGYIFEQVDGNGNTRAMENPRVKIVDKLYKNVLQTSSKLCINAATTVGNGSPSNVKSRTKNVRKAQQSQTNEQINDTDSLLAQPGMRRVK